MKTSDALKHFTAAAFLLFYCSFLALICLKLMAVPHPVEALSDALLGTADVRDLATCLLIVLAVPIIIQVAPTRHTPEFMREPWLSRGFEVCYAMIAAMVLVLWIVDENLPRAEPVFVSIGVFFTALEWFGLKRQNAEDK